MRKQWHLTLTHVENDLSYPPRTGRGDRPVTSKLTEIELAGLQASELGDQAKDTAKQAQDKVIHVVSSKVLQMYITCTQTYIT